jgi:branched-chain amino acid transport system permease protein
LSKLLDESGTSGFTPTELARFVFGAGILLVIMFEPEGLAGLGRRFSAAVGRRRHRASRAAPATAEPS